MTNCNCPEKRTIREILTKREIRCVVKTSKCIYTGLPRELLERIPIDELNLIISKLDLILKNEQYWQVEALNEN
jgi:hypothetical protein